MVYGAIVGALFSPFIAIGPISSSPELALLVGNVFSFAVSPKGKRMLTLQKKEAVSNGIHHFTFVPDKKLSFRPGQYLEWTLGHDKVDSRGNRRYFTIASSPTEDTVQLGVKVYTPSSSFKTKLLALAPGDTIVAGQLAGEFILPKNPRQKLVFIAGGIGITPFRSMIKNLIDRGEKRDIVLFYSNRTRNEIAYRTLFDEATQKFGMKIIYTITDHGERINADSIKKEVPDYRERTFYISGSHAMTNSLHKILRDMGVPQANIKTDFFPGLA
jgi:ferredoxin-NADP reductase